MSYKLWMKAVDSLTEARFGISVHDLPDMMFRDSFDNGVSPESFVEDDVYEAVLEQFPSWGDE